MKTILVINSKGGSGKTTVSTNLASYYASKSIKTALKDYDPQGSSLQWLKVRPDEKPQIHGANAAPQKSSPLSSIHGHIPSDTEVMIIDAPAGTKGLLLQELVRRSHFILIPVAPSAIDIHATADFVKEMFLFGGARNSKAKIAVIANRVRSATSVYEAVKRFLVSLKLPFLTTISDSPHYLDAVEHGLGVFEMDEEVTAAERKEFMPIFDWIEGNVPDHLIVRKDGKVALEGSGIFPAVRSGGKTLITDILSATGGFKKHS